MHLGAPAHGLASPQPASRCAAALWVACGALALAIAAWGPVAGLCITNDDIKWVRGPERDMPLPAALESAWLTQPSFRPLEVVVAHACDPVTLGSGPVAWIQAAGLLAFLAASAGLLRECFPGTAAAVPIGILWILLSPATGVSVWQMDACSQTWSAACGAWCVLLAWRALRGAPLAGSIAAAACAVAALLATGLLVKESMLGWAAGLAGALGAAIAWSLMRAGHDARAASTGLRARSFALAVPVVMVPVAYLAVRLAWSAMSGLLGGDGESRYQVELGANLLVNAVVSVAGVIGTGPFHLVADGEAPAWLRAVPAVAVLCVSGMLLVATLCAYAERSLLSGFRMGAICFTVAVTMASLAATLPMGSVSELYGLGANLGAAALVAGGACVLWRAASAVGPVARAGAACALALVLAAGSYGVASRAMQFRVVWATTRALNAAIVALQDSVPALPPGTEGSAGTVHVPTSCLTGVTHSQYLMPPLQTLSVDITERWLSRRDPSRPIVFSIGTAPSVPMPREIVLDCGSIPRHGPW